VKCSDLNSAKAEAKLVKAPDYLVAINDNSDNTSGQRQRNSLKPTPLSIRLTTPTDWGPGHNRGKARVDPGAIPLLVKNFKRDALNQPF
jgi:hypothetical protein